MASTVLPNGIIVPEKFSRDWYADLYHNWQELDNLLGGGTPKDGTLTIQKNGDTVGTFSANQATDETINITVPDVNDGTLTIQQNGTTVDTFTANSSSDKTVNIQCVDLNSNQTVAGNKEFTGTTTAHDVIPSATDTYNFGSSTAQWNNAYIKSLTINGVAAGDILTHNASEFVGISDNQTIGGVKTFSNYARIQGSYTGNEFSSNARTVLELRANRDTADKSGIYLSKFRQNRAQGEMTATDSQMLNIDVLENGVRTNNLFRFTFNGWVNDVPTKAYLVPYSSGTQAFLGTSSNPWADVGTKAINGLNPGALSLPDLNSAVDISGYININQLSEYTALVDGYISICGYASSTNAILIKDKNYNFAMSSRALSTSLGATTYLAIPIVKNHVYEINCSAVSTLSYAYFYPCQGNV